MSQSMRFNIQRLWFYFRVGHGSYLAFAIGLTEFLTVQYVLVIQRLGLPIRFAYFIVGFAFVYGLACVILGYLHKRMQMRVETDIAALSNPYTYRVTPGKEQRVMVPLSLFQIKISRLLMLKLGLLTVELDSEYDSWEDILKRMIRGEEFR